MRKLTSKIGSFVIAAALIAFASACTSSPLAPDDFGDDEVCIPINGHIVCY